VAHRASRSQTHKQNGPLARPASFDSTAALLRRRLDLRRGGLLDAETQRDAANELRAEYQQHLASIDEEMRAKITEALKEGQAMRDEIIADSHAKSDAILTKKERIKLDREKAKLAKNLSGIKEMEELPDVLFVIDPKKEAIAVQEAGKLGIPVVGIVDTNCDPDPITHVIPGNDDAIRAIKLFTGKIADAVLVERRGEQIVGLVTLAHRSVRGQIGLLAVDQSARGSGVGRRLLEAARVSCHAAGCDWLDVVTQGVNLAACGLYEAAGYSLAEQQDIFHFWSEPT